MIDMVFDGDFDIIPMFECLTVLIRAILGCFSSGEHSTGGEKMKTIRRAGLDTALFILHNRNIGRHAVNIRLAHIYHILYSQTKLVYRKCIRSIGRSICQ